MKKQSIMAAIAITSALISTPVNAQQITLGTDMFKTIAEGTLNIEMTANTKDNLDITSSLTYNPWVKGSTQNKSRSLSIGSRFALPLKENPGIWIESGATVSEFSRSTRKMSGTLEEGTTLGLYSGLGYSFNLPYGFRLDAGAFIWSGVRKIDSYSCRVCGDLTSTRKQIFLLPKEIRFTLSKAIFTTD